MGESKRRRVLAQWCQEHDYTPCIGLPARFEECLSEAPAGLLRHGPAGSRTRYAPFWLTYAAYILAAQSERGFYEAWQAERFRRLLRIAAQPSGCATLALCSRYTESLLALLEAEVG